MYNIISPINSLGYGIAGLNLCKEIDKVSPASLFIIGQPSVSTQNDHEIISDMIKNSHKPDFSAPCIRIWHQHDMAQFVGNGLKVGFPIFELDNFSDIEKHHLSHPDKLFVCSSWAKDIIANTINISEDDVYVVPLGVDSNIFSPSNDSNGEKTVFFNCGKWEIRKGHDIIVKAFNKAFSTNDDVELHMMCENPFNSEDENKAWKTLYKESKLGSKISLLGRVSTHEEVYNIMANVDCGIFPSRAEGWNLELLEMMSCNKPVITTNYSAHTEFCTPDNAFLVDVDNLEPAIDGKWFHGDVGRWASLGDKQVDQIAEYMVHVHNNSIKTNKNGVETAKKFTWANSARKIKEALQDV
jgi:glycosyltransferase involved in cell wall biosynthesis